MLKNILKIGKPLPKSILKTINGGRKALGCPTPSTLCPDDTYYDVHLCSCEPN